MKPTVSILISGRGSNMEALASACDSKVIPANVGVVISNIADAPGLDRAAGFGIPTAVVPHAGRSKAAFEADLQAILKHYKTDIICLAGFMRILSADFVNLWEGRILNIHPSLLPDFAGTNVYARTLAAGVRESGCTVHRVTAEVDSGDILVQSRVPVRAGDTESTLAERILQAEHVAYPQALAMLVSQLAAKPHPERKVS
ncbi:MAG: phosphoribosylglycinamide formyltransferase [Proteobacteria bacterium]|nr:phosphoribosylglycinamide formyltransferase [Pseudomonadota bacterium]